MSAHAERVTTWFRERVSECVATGAASTIAEAFAALGGHGTMAFGMIISDLDGADMLRELALEALCAMMARLSDDEIADVFRIIGTGRPDQAMVVRARLTSAQLTADQATVDAFARALADTDARTVAATWRALEVETVVFDLEIAARDRLLARLRRLVVDRLDAILPELPDEAWLRAVPALRRWGIPIAIDIEERTAEVLSRRGGDDRDREPINDDLDRAIANDPDDLGAYAVYADWLSERAHPRGALIVMQLRDDVDASAVDNYLDEHAEQLLGPLALHREVYDARDRPAFEWRGGFIERARLSVHDEISEGAPTLCELLELVAAHPSARFLAELEIGLDGAPNNGLANVIETIVRLGLPRLGHLAFGLDLDEAQAQISNYDVGDLSPLWPRNLWGLYIWGRTIELGEIDLPLAQVIEVVSARLSAEVVQSIAGARWPSLHHLELSLGRLAHGSTASMDDIARLLARTDLGGLRHLGITRCDFADDVCRALAKSPFAGELTELDLSLGGLTVRGATALTRARKRFGALHILDVSRSFLDHDAIAKLERAFPEVVSHGQRDDDGGDDDDEDDDGHYDEVGE